MPIMEGYGLTETSPIVSCSPPGTWKYRRLGCVGAALPGVTILIIDPTTMVNIYIFIYFKFIILFFYKLLIIFCSKKLNQVKKVKFVLQVQE